MSHEFRIAVAWGNSKDTHNTDSIQLQFTKPDSSSLPYPRPRAWFYILGFNILTSAGADTVHHSAET